MTMAAPVGQEFASGCSGLGPLGRLQSKYWPVLQPSEGLARVREYTFIQLGPLIGWSAGDLSLLPRGLLGTTDCLHKKEAWQWASAYLPTH